MLALQSGAPIVPVAIAGSYEIMPKHSRWIRGGTIRVRIFPAIETADCTAADRDELQQAVRRPIATALENGRDA